MSCSRDDTNKKLDVVSEKLVSVDQQDELNRLRSILEETGESVDTDIQSGSNNDCSVSNEWVCDDPVTVTFTVYYRGCPFLTSRDVEICLNIITGEVRQNLSPIHTYFYDPLSDPACFQINQELLNLYSLGDYEGVRDSLNRRLWFLEIGFEYQLAAALIGSSSLPTCGSSAQGIITMSNYRSQCVRDCIYIDNGIPANLPFFCGKGCCVRTTRYCLNDRFQIVVENPNDLYEVISPCTWDPEPYPGCPGVTVGDCENTCFKLSEWPEF
jgi:hypothetical protein